MPHELNNEALLLLYLAGELSPKQRMQLDRQLAADAGLQAELRRLEEMTHSFETKMALADAPPLPGEATALRRIGIAMRQHMALAAAQADSTKTAEPAGRRYPKWTYWGGAAAAVAAIMLAWWGHQPPSPLGLPSMHERQFSIPVPVPPSDDSRQIAEDLHENFDGAGATQPEKNVASLELAAEQLADLTRASHSQKDYSYFGFDGNE